MGAAGRGSPALIYGEGAPRSDPLVWEWAVGLEWVLLHPAQPHPCVAGPSIGLPTGRSTGSCPSPWPHAVLAGAELTTMH